MTNQGTNKDERRKYSRLNSLYLISYVSRDADEQRHNLSMARTLDIGKGGVRVEVYRDVPEGSSMEMEIAIKENIYSVRGKVLHSHGTDSNTWEIGIEFDSINEELSKELDRFLLDVSGDSKSLNSSLSDVLMAQDFQDLTGQIIRRVITLVQDVEEGLVDLIRISSGGIASTRPDKDKEEKQEGERDIKAEGPQVPGQKTSDYVQGQDDVDDLLSSLGF